MDNVEYRIINQIEAETRVLMATDIVNKNNRTLLYGYTCDRDTWHVYLKDCEIHAVVYNGREDDSELYRIVVVSNSDYIPNKRLYPARCDFEFCKLLKERGVDFTFTAWEEVSEKKIYYGRTDDKY